VELTTAQEQCIDDQRVFLFNYILGTPVVCNAPVGLKADVQALALAVRSMGHSNGCARHSMSTSTKKAGSITTKHKPHCDSKEPGTSQERHLQRSHNFKERMHMLWQNQTTKTQTAHTLHHSRAISNH
jgi:hypothetical protein